jgi:hypothetical protein
MIMKMRKGWTVMWADGTTWYGDCDKWAATSRAAGHRVSRVMIMGRKWACGACEFGGRH